MPINVSLYLLPVDETVEETVDTQLVGQTLRGVSDVNKVHEATTGSSFANKVEDTEDSKPKDGRR